MRPDVIRALVGVATASIRPAFLHLQSHTTRGLRLPRRSFGGSHITSNPDRTNNVITSCNTDPEMDLPNLLSSRGLGSACLLRDAILSNADGTTVRLGDQMGTRTSIVVFLRHLA